MPAVINLVFLKKFTRMLLPAGGVSVAREKGAYVRTAWCHVWGNIGCFLPRDSDAF